MGMTLKEFTFKEAKYPYWESTYAVLVLPVGVNYSATRRYTISAAESESALTVDSESLDHLIEILQWCKAEYEAHPDPDEEEPLDEPVVDDPNPVEEEG